jgi:hypothetical protein
MISAAQLLRSMLRGVVATARTFLDNDQAASDSPRLGNLGFPDLPS